MGMYSLFQNKNILLIFMLNTCNKNTECMYLTGNMDKDMLGVIINQSTDI